MQSRAPTRRKTIWGWALYDFGNSAFFTVIVTFVCAAFFVGGLILTTVDEQAGVAASGRVSTS